MRAHNEFNRSFRRFGVGVDREMAYADRVMSALQRYLPKKMQLGVTVFLEHVTATGAHMLFMEPLVAESMHPETLRFWRWHAVEELEHKAVAFDLFKMVGGGYFLRAFSAIAALLLLALPFGRIVRRMRKEPSPPSNPVPVTSAGGTRKIPTGLRVLLDPCIPVGLDGGPRVLVGQRAFAAGQLIEHRATS